MKHIKRIILVALAALAASCSPTNHVPCGCGEQRESPTAYAVADSRDAMPRAQHPAAPEIVIAGAKPGIASGANGATAGSKPGGTGDGATAVGEARRAVPRITIDGSNVVRMGQETN